MQLNPTAVSLHNQVKDWRHHIHANPELSMQEYNTAKFIKQQLDNMGVSYQEFAGTGVVASIKKGIGNRAIGLRCDTDALPMQEDNSFAHKSQNDGVMHACGHDGHTAMLLGAVKALLEDGQFDGTVYFVFQPGEEVFAGADKMIKDGLFDSCPMEEIYGMHNWPGIDLGKAGVAYGACMAATDSFHITVKGKGAHAAMPSLANDPMVVSTQLITALQTLISRNVSPVDKAVVSTTIIQGGTANNVIGDTVQFEGTVRTFSKQTREMLEKRFIEMCKGFGIAFGVEIDCKYIAGYPATINSDEQTGYAESIMEEVLGESNVIKNIDPSMGGEDFAYYLEKVDGNFIWLGNGDSDNLHTTKFDFNDDIIPMGISYWISLIENRLPIEKQ